MLAGVRGTAGQHSTVQSCGTSPAALSKQNRSFTQQDKHLQSCAEAALQPMCQGEGGAGGAKMWLLSAVGLSPLTKIHQAAVLAHRSDFSIGGGS